MIRLKNSNSGSVIITLLIIASIIMLGYRIWKSDEVNQAETMTSDNSQNETVSTPKPDIEVTTLTTNYDYPGSGKATRRLVDGQYEVTISAVLPALSEGGYYQAFLEGPSTINIGRLKKEGTTLKITYKSFQNLDFHNDIRITVNGADFTIEKNSRTLPFDIMTGSFN